MSLKPEDTTEDALRVLADAVHRERVPGIVEFRLLEHALETATVTPTAENLALAAAAFDALDHDFRQRIIDRAHGLAHAVADQRRTTTKPDPGRPARSPQGLASPLLAALNQGRRR
ncbi:hypothetical protein [Azospirillum sp.]|uniref:hypothetical protein n=1 Tax=Azospirillum sp. TaxID=34012 RepID=UPI002D5EC48E|nr:hypothetical protein [Azospirillum sp.]HYD68202.1 hypothetical protein [Azospirillum sp.]